MSQIKKSDERFYLTIACLIAVAAILPIAYFGIPEAVDMGQHFKFAQTYYESITTGDGFPGLSGNENFGYSDVGIRFYPPLEYYFLAFVRILVGNWYDTAWLNFMFWMVSGCLGVYFWTKCWLSTGESAIAACFYAIIPFHLNQLYVSYNNYSEFAGASILTFCFAFMTRIFQREKKSDVFGLAVFYALLILTHLPLTIIGSLCLLVYALTFLRNSRIVGPLIKCAVAGGVALSASAFYWVGMVTEMKWLNHVSDQYSGGRFSFDEGFFPFYYHAVLFKDTVWIIDFAAVFTVLFLSTAIIYFLYKKRGDADKDHSGNIFQNVLPLGLMTFFMVTPLSRPIWELVTPLQKVQFPARWMAIVSMCGAVVAAASVHYFIKGNFFKQRVWIYACIVFIFTVAAYNFIYIFHPTSFAPVNREKFEITISELPNNQSFYCWWAIWSKAGAFNTKEKILAGNRQSQIISWEAEKRVFEIAAGRETAVRIATFYYPHWKAEVNGKPVEIEKDENGTMLISVGDEKSTVEIYFQEPFAVRAASILSLLTWLFLAGVAVLISNKKLFFARQFE